MDEAFKKVTGLSLEDGIEKAIEGGWDYNKHLEHSVFPSQYNVCDDGSILCTEEDGNVFGMVPTEKYILDTLFWQSLGKALGWIEICDNPDHGFIDSVGGEISRLGCPLCGHNDDHVIESTRDNWKKEWHRFIDALIEEEVCQ